MFAILKMLLESSLTLCRLLTQFATIFVPLAKKTAQKRLPLVAIGDDWYAAAAALLIGNLL